MSRLTRAIEPSRIFCGVLSGGKTGLKPRKCPVEGPHEEPLAGVFPGHRERNTIRGNQALDSPHPPASVTPGFASPAPQQSVQGFIGFGRRALGHRTAAVEKSVTFLACHAQFAVYGLFIGLRVTSAARDAPPHSSVEASLHQRLTPRRCGG